MNKGLLIVISGPSGAGKGTVYNAVTAKMPNLFRSVSVTTRCPRRGEIEGVHYYFKTVEEYDKMKNGGEFLETAKVYDNFYGTPAKPVFEAIERGEDVFFEIDIEGAKQVKAKYPECVAIFLMPPSFAVLESRLRGRGTESEIALAKRIGSARAELGEYANFDYIVFNDKVEDAVQKVMEIIAAERSAVSRNKDKIKKMLEI